MEYVRQIYAKMLCRIMANPPVEYTMPVLGIIQCMPEREVYPKKKIPAGVNTEANRAGKRQLSGDKSFPAHDGAFSPTAIIITITLQSKNKPVFPLLILYSGPHTSGKNSNIELKIA